MFELDVAEEATQIAPGSRDHMSIVDRLPSDDRTPWMPPSQAALLVEQGAVTQLDVRAKTSSALTLPTELMKRDAVLLRVEPYGACLPAAASTTPPFARPKLVRKATAPVVEDAPHTERAAGCLAPPSPSPSPSPSPPATPRRPPPLPARRAPPANKPPPVASDPSPDPPASRSPGRGDRFSILPRRLPSIAVLCAAALMTTMLVLTTIAGARHALSAPPPAPPQACSTGD